jgi:protein involved in polysaccharide export with SLBB domain
MVVILPTYVTFMTKFISKPGRVRSGLGVLGWLVSAIVMAQTALPASNITVGTLRPTGVAATARSEANAAPRLEVGQPATATSKLITKPPVRSANRPRAKAAGVGDGTDDATGNNTERNYPPLEETEFQRFVQRATNQTLKLFGYDLFEWDSSFLPVQAAPVPAGYILGPGDEVVVQINGLVDFDDRLVIDRDGRVMVPKVGPLNLAGVTLNNAEKVFAAHIGKVYRNFSVSVTMGRLRSIEVFVVGQARQPGKYLVSSLSTLINALFETGGPGSNGSLRAIELRRGGKKIASVDLYAFLAFGDNSADVQLQAGDIIFIPPAGARAALSGTINTPAIYELQGNESISQILALSGGLPALAAPQKAQLERLDAKREIARYVEDFALDAKGLGTVLKAGDILTVFQISPQIANVVTLQGNVASPLRYTYRPGMRVADLLADKRLLIPGSYWLQINKGTSTGSYSRAEVNLDYATIQRLDPTALRTKVIAFNLRKAIAQDKEENLELQSGDIVTVYRPDEAGQETENSVTITGEVVGGTRRFVWREGFAIKDIIPSTQWLVDYYSYWQSGTARGLNNDINWEYAQVIRRVPANLRSKTVTFNLGRAVLDGSPSDNIKLEPGDQITLFTTAQLPVPAEQRNQLVTISGEVMAAGKYQLSPGETLPELVKRAGGLSRSAFSYGIIFTRESTRLQQQENLDKAISRLEAEINSQTSTAIQNVVETEKSAAMQAQIAVQKLMLNRMQSLKASGRIALELDPINPTLPRIVLEDGDKITVPQQPSFVGVFGEVFAESSIIHRPGSTVSDYLSKAGLTRDADTDNLLVIRADGTVEGGRGSGFSFWSASALGKRLNPGDSVFVPGVIDRRTFYSQFIQGFKDWTSILYQFGLSAAAIKTLRQ